MQRPRDKGNGGSKELKGRSLVWLEHEDGGGLWKEMWSELRARSDLAIGAC